MIFNYEKVIFNCEKVIFHSEKVIFNCEKMIFHISAPCTCTAAASSSPREGAFEAEEKAESW